MYGGSAISGLRPGSAPLLPAAEHYYGGSSSGKLPASPSLTPISSAGLSPRCPNPASRSNHDSSHPLGMNSEHLLNGGRTGSPASTTSSAHASAGWSGTPYAHRYGASSAPSRLLPADVDVDLSGFRVRVLDTALYPPPYALRGTLESHAFTSEWAYPGADEEAVVWRVRPHFRYRSDAYATEHGPARNADGAGAGASGDGGSSRSALVVECYCGGSGAGNTFVGRCVLPAQELFQCPADRPTQLTLHGEGRATGALSFYPILTQVERVTLVMSDVVVTPNPLPLLFRFDSPDSGLRMDANSALCLAVVAPPEPGACRRDATPVPPSCQSSRSVEWASLPRLAVTTTLEELMAGYGLECRLYAMPVTVGSNLSSGRALTDLRDLTYVGRFIVHPRLPSVFRGRGGGANSSSFHVEVELAPVAGASNVLCWARGTVELLGGCFVYQQPQATVTGGGNGSRDRSTMPVDPPLVLSQPRRDGDGEVRRLLDDRGDLVATPIGSVSINSGALPPSGLASSGRGDVRECGIAPFPPSSALRTDDAGSQVLERVVAQQAELVESIRGRLKAVQHKKTAMQAELARVKEQEAQEMREAAETRGRLEEERARCAEQLRALEEQLAAVQERRAAVASDYAARDAERRVAAERAAQEKAEVARIRGRLEELQRDMQQRLEGEERRYSARVESARVAGAHTERNSKWLAEVEPRVAAAGSTCDTIPHL